MLRMLHQKAQASLFSTFWLVVPWIFTDVARVFFNPIKNSVKSYLII